MIQLVVNTNMLRAIDERKLINAYARLLYFNEEDTSNDVKIKENLKQLLDWDINGDNGLGIFCSRFESIKSKDWNILIQFIKSNKDEIKKLSYSIVKKKKLESIKLVRNSIETKEEKKKEHFIDENYSVSGRGKKAKTCTYEGREYSSRQECMYKEGISKAQLYKYLRKTNQV